MKPYLSPHISICMASLNCWLFIKNGLIPLDGIGPQPKNLLVGHSSIDKLRKKVNRETNPF
jgi:hypothetical protein